MSNEVDHKQLIYIIESAPGFTSGEHNGILSGDDSVVNDFKSIVIPFCCSGNSVEDAAIEKIVNTADYDSIKKVIANLKDGEISDLDSVECGKFAKEFVQEIKENIKNKKWYHKIVIMQCAIIDAIHTIFKECDEQLACVESGIILGLATGFEHWFENSRIEDSNFGKIDKADTDIAGKVDSFLKEKLNLNTENSYNIFSVPWGLKQIFECFKKSYNANINQWIGECDKQVDACMKGLNKCDIKKIKKELKNISENISDNGDVDSELITKLSKTLNMIFNVGDVYLIKEEVISSVNAVKQKRQQMQQKSKSSDNERQEEHIKPEESNDGNVAMPGANDQRFKEFFKSFEENYWDTNCNWVDACTQGLGSADDIKMLKTQLTKLITASTRNDWIAASSAMIIVPLSNTLGKIFGVNDSNKDGVKSMVQAVIKQQQHKLLQTFLNVLENSCYPFNANAWWNNLVKYVSFSKSLESPLWDFMQCVTAGEIDGNILSKVTELSDALCKAFAVNNTDNVTTRLKGIVQRAREAQKTTKEKYNADIVENLLKVIDCVAAQGYVDLSSESNIWAWVDNELCSFIETPEKRQEALDVIYEVFQTIEQELDQETLAQNAATLLVNSGVINTDEKDQAVKKIKEKIEELRNRRKKDSSTAQKEPAPKPQIVKNDTKQLQHTSSLLTPEPKPPKTISQKQEIPANTNTLPTLSEKSADFKVTTSQNNTDNLEDITINSYTPNDTGQIIHTEKTAQIPSVLANHWKTCKKNLSDYNQPFTGGSCVTCNKIVRIVTNLQKNKPSEAIKLIRQLQDTNTNKDSHTDIHSTSDMWIKHIEKNTVTFSKHDRQFMRFAKRAVSKQERQKHKDQKTKNTNTLLNAIHDIPSRTIPQHNNNPQYTKLEQVLNSDHSNLVDKLKQLDLTSYLSEPVTIKKIENIAKQIRKQEDNINSDSLMALAVLYTILRNIANDNTTEQDTSTTQNTSTATNTLIAFAKWFNKYVSPRSAVRSPKVVKALNDTVGNMAGDKKMFKYGQLTRAKNAIKGLAKKISTKSDASVDTNSGSEGHKEHKRDKFKKLFSRKKKSGG